MSVKNFRFVSPGVFVNEIDNSQLPASPVGIGPVIIGRAEKGQALRPVTVNSFSEFVQTFGVPSPGESGDDVWRQGNNKSAATYGMYAAQAYLRNSAPLTYIRLLGDQTTVGTRSGDGGAGWSTSKAWALVIFESGSGTQGNGLETVTGGALTGALGAIIYTNTDAKPVLSGSIIDNGAAAAGYAFVTCFSQSAGASAGSVLTLEHSGAADATGLGIQNTYIFTGVSASATPGLNQFGVGSDAGVTMASNLVTIINASASGDFIAQLDSGSSNRVRIQAITGAANSVVSPAGNTSYVLTASTRGGEEVPLVNIDTVMDLNAFNLDNTNQSIAAAASSFTGSLASGSAAPGRLQVTNIAVTGTNFVVADTGVRSEFKLIIQDYKGTDDLTATFNFDENSPRYIRKVLNTNPQLTNSGIVENEVNYFLGETFDRHVAANINADGTQLRTMATILELSKTDATAALGGTYLAPLQGAQTPWILSCDLGAGRKQLFRFHALGEPGDWTNKNLKISIQDIKVSTNDATEYGSFSVVIRHLSDSDNVVRVVEQFDNCDLNPNSLNYVARKVGDKNRTWSEDERRYQETGDWDNRSDYVRIEVASDVDAGIMNANLIPFGWRGLVKYIDETNLGGVEYGTWLTGALGADTEMPAGIAQSPANILITSASNGYPLVALDANILYPAPELRVSASDGNLSNVTDAYFGLQTTKTAGGTVFAPSTIDVLRPRGGAVGEMFSLSTGTNATTGLEVSTEFSLDDLSGSTAGTTSWQNGSYAAGTSWTAANGLVSGVLDQGFDRFTVPIYGGFDGVDVTEMDPFANRNIPSASPTDQNSYVFNSIRRAIDSVADPEVVEMNLASVPGLTQEGLTNNLINVCEDRADALAVIDLPNAGYLPRQEGTAASRKNTASNLRQVISSLRSRGINSSYGCCFYPWVRARDSINGAFVWLPPSIAALGTFSSSQRRTQVWFAPAGFNRGGLTEGSAGLPVVNVSHQLRRKDRDDLYAANINPIAKFPAEGIVIFGQKTLQVTPSALDRINVRRLMIFIKKRISQIAAGILFDPNVPTTWARFKSRAVPFLEDVQTNFGLSEFKLILDETTTTPDLIDRNILYARIYLKPTRAIEFIAIDFNITRTGASFED